MQHYLWETRKHNYYTHFKHIFDGGRGMGLSYGQILTGIYYTEAVKFDRVGQGVSIPPTLKYLAASLAITLTSEFSLSMRLTKNL